MWSRYDLISQCTSGVARVSSARGPMLGSAPPPPRLVNPASAPGGEEKEKEKGLQHDKVERPSSFYNSPLLQAGPAPPPRLAPGGHGPAPPPLATPLQCTYKRHMERNSKPLLMDVNGTAKGMKRKDGDRLRWRI